MSHLQQSQISIHKFHQRQLVVRSRPTYSSHRYFSTNSTNGSWWSVHVPPTAVIDIFPQIPPTAVGGPFTSCLVCGKVYWAGLELSTNSRWWSMMMRLPFLL